MAGNATDVRGGEPGVHGGGERGGQHRGGNGAGRRPGQGRGAVRRYCRQRGWGEKGSVRGVRDGSLGRMRWRPGMWRRSWSVAARGHWRRRAVAAIQASGAESVRPARLRSAHRTVSGSTSSGGSPGVREASRRLSSAAALAGDPASSALSQAAHVRRQATRPPACSPGTTRGDCRTRQASQWLMGPYSPRARGCVSFHMDNGHS